MTVTSLQAIMPMQASDATYLSVTVTSLQAIMPMQASDATYLSEVNLLKMAKSLIPAFFSTTNVLQVVNRLSTLTKSRHGRAKRSEQRNDWGRPVEAKGSHRTYSRAVSLVMAGAILPWRLFPENDSPLHTCTRHNDVHACMSRGHMSRGARKALTTTCTVSNFIPCTATLRPHYDHIFTTTETI